MPNSTETKNRETLVAAFQDRIGAPNKLSICHSESDGTVMADAADIVLLACSISLREMSTKLKSIYKETKKSINKSEERLMRAQLMLEELSETVLALYSRDEVELLDALADLSYVVSGTATTYDLPLDAAFQEVHRSNMTKGEVRHAEGIKGKGEGYSAPDLVSVLNQYRNRN
jgi:phosphoribosyl-ATP pyrophosphohydrolase